MLRLKRILYPTDFSETARQVFDHALFLAEQHRAELHMLHAVVLHDHDPADPEQHFPDTREIFARLFAIAESEMARLAGDRGEGFSLVQASRRGFSVPEVILDYAQEIDADLVVMGTHGRRGAERWMLGSAAARVVRQAHCPVLTLRGREQPTPIEAIERLLVPIDFSEHSRTALRAARELALAYRAEIDLLHVSERPPMPHFYTRQSEQRMADSFAELEQRSREELDKLAAETGRPDLACRGHLVRGRAAHEIVRFAGERDSDLIVLSTHGLSGLERMLLGSTTEEVVRTADCPVFVARAFGKSLA